MEDAGAEPGARRPAHDWGWADAGADPRGGGEGGSGPAPGASRCLELCPICRTADLLRGAGPPELRGQIDDVSREALLTLRALVDHYLERIDSQPAATEGVEEIPID